MLVQISIILIDDDAHDNYLNQIAISEFDAQAVVVTKNSAIGALEFLKTNTNANLHPDLILLDVNMPRMNGWDFLREYNFLEDALQGNAIIIMLTTSANPEDVIRAKEWSFVADYITKPLTMDKLNRVSTEFFNELKS